MKRCEDSCCFAIGYSFASLGQGVLKASMNLMVNASFLSSLRVAITYGLKFGSDRSFPSSDSLC